MLEAGETARPAELLHRENRAINACPLWAKVSPQSRLRALRIALPRDHAEGSKVPAQTLGDRVAWIIVDGEVEQDGVLRGPGSLLYPEALLADAPLPDKDGLAVATSEVRALGLRCDDFHEVCDDDSELGELLLEALAAEIAARNTRPPVSRMVIGEHAPGVESAPTDPNMKAVGAAPSRRAEPSQPPRIAATLPSLPRSSAPRLAHATTPPSGVPVPPIGPAGVATKAAAAPSITGREATLPPPATGPLVGSDLSNAVTLPPMARGAAPGADERASTEVDVEASSARASTIPEDDVRSATVPAPAPRPSRTTATQGTPSHGGAAAIPSLRRTPLKGTPVKGATPAQPLIMQRDEASAAAAQLDRAFDGLATEPISPGADTTSPTSTTLRPPAKPASRLPLPAPIHEGEVSSEADEAPTLEKGPSLSAATQSRAIGNQSEPEISIERFVELEVEEPMHETDRDESSPEIMVLTPGRAITADDTNLVSGSIDSAPAKK